MSLKLPPVYAITDRRVSGIDDHAAIAARLFAVGLRFLQVREKELPDAELLAAVEAARELGLRYAARVLVNDRVDIARVAGLGVHLGEEDLRPPIARRLLPPEAVIGLSTHDPEQAARAFADESCDYVGFGPVFSSGTKSGRAPRGLAELSRAAQGKTKPLVAIGGITAENLDSALDAGADCVAMIGGLLANGAIEENARRVLDRARRRSLPGRVFLVGFMASGKTAVGRRIADRLGLPFIDLDQEIERTSGATVRAIFEASGEDSFRQRESLFLEATASVPDAVIATGGGCYAREENRRTIARLGTAVFLDVPFPLLLSRLSEKTDRPLFEGPEQAAQLFAERAPFYRMGTLQVPLEGQSIEEAADRVLSAIFDRSGPSAW